MNSARRSLPSITFHVSRFTPEPALWLTILAGLLALTLAYQSQRPLFVDIGGPIDAPHVSGFLAPEHNAQATFRWSTAQSELYFRGVGKPLSPFVVRLQLSSGRAPGSAPLEVGVSVNGHPAPLLKLTSQSNAYAVVIDPAWVDLSGDLRLDFSSPTFKSGTDKRDLGFLLDFVRVELPPGLIVPSLTQLFWLLVCGALIYLLVRSVGLRSRTSGLLSLLFLFSCAAILAAQRLLLTLFTTRLAATLVLAFSVAILAEAVTRWLASMAGWRGERALPEWAWTWLRGLVLLAVVLKVGGLLYPHTIIIDAEFHLKYVTYAAEGRPFEEYFGRGLSFAVMPKQEWGAATAFIPYSPFFYFAAAPLAKLPLPLALTVPIASGVQDALKVPLIFLLGLALGGVRGAARRAVASAAIYSFIPATFLLQQWGNWPTLTSLWLLTLWAAIACLFWARFTNPIVWVASTAALALTMLSYTVTAAYTGIFIGMLLVGGWLFAAGDRKRWALLALSLVVGTLASMLIFYGRYIPEVINQTLPTFGHAVEAQGKLTTLRPTLGGFINGTLGRAMQLYNLAMIYALGFAGALFVLGRSIFLGARATKTRSAYGIIAETQGVNTHNRTALLPHPTPSPYRRIWLAAWLVTFPLFTMLDFYVDQAFKEFWFALPALSVVSGIWLLSMRAKRSGVYTLFAWLLSAVLVWQSLSLWIFRLLFHNR